MDKNRPANKAGKPADPDVEGHRLGRIAIEAVVAQAQGEGKNRDWFAIALAGLTLYTFAAIEADIPSAQAHEVLDRLLAKKGAIARDGMN